MTKLKPYDFQEHAISWIKKQRTGLLALDMGLGKSMVAILAAQEVNAIKILVICPASVKYGWAKEIDKWTRESSKVIEGRKDRLENRKWTIINYDLLISKPILMQLIRTKWNVLILDELHYSITLKTMLLRGQKRCTILKELPVVRIEYGD